MAGHGTGGRGTTSKARTPRAPRRQSPEVYRRRRIAVVVLMVLILAVLGVGVSAAVVAVGSLAADGVSAPPSQGPQEVTAQTDAATPPSSAAPTDAAPGTAAPTATQSATPSCDPQFITIAASTDKAVYAAAEKPVFTLKVTNGNPVPCEVNVGTKQMEFLVVSGVDRVFSSKDCQATSEDLPKTIPAGGSETANFPWSRVRSVEGCKAVSVQPKPGIYVLTASLGATTSSKAVFELK